MKNKTLEPPTRTEFFEWALSKKNISQETFEQLPRSERLALSRECGADTWLLRRRHPLWSETAESKGL